MLSSNRSFSFTAWLHKKQCLAPLAPRVFFNRSFGDFFSVWPFFKLKKFPIKSSDFASSWTCNWILVSLNITRPTDTARCKVACPWLKTYCKQLTAYSFFFSSTDLTRLNLFCFFVSAWDWGVKCVAWLVYLGVESFSYEWMRVNASYADEQGDWKREEEERKQENQSNIRARARDFKVNSFWFSDNFEHFEGRVNSEWMASKWRVNGKKWESEQMVWKTPEKI